jgi:MoaA/NifB/PqqE/SkfB family radical SAM enzyme
MEYWVFTNGWKLNSEKASALKQKGLAGVLVSIDHFIAEKHDHFRGMEGAFDNAVNAVLAAKQASLLTALTLVATNEFVTEENVMRYLVFAKNIGADFVQFLEPEPEGRFRGMNVELSPEKQAILEHIFRMVNTQREFREFPLITYYPYLRRTMGCAARGQHFLYIDAMGDVHPCPFCRHKTFSMLSGDVLSGISAMRSQACVHGSRIGLILNAPEKKTEEKLIRP